MPGWAPSDRVRPLADAAHGEPGVSTVVIFDVDGTLCDTVGVDDECFSSVASRTFGSRVEASSWEAAPLTTDAGILEWLWRRHRGRRPTTGEAHAFIDEFVASLSRARDEAPQRFRAVAGAARAIEALGANSCLIAIATGGWERSARLKLDAAGLPSHLLQATSDDAADRAEIFALARRRAVSRDHREERAVLVGDGAWDLRVAHQLGWAFIGIGRGQRARRLRECGAVSVLGDLTDTAGFLSLVKP